MEAFSLLKYWRGGGSAGASDVSIINLTANPKPAVDGDATAENANDDGPFFDLEFTVDDEEDEDDDEDEDEEREFKFTLSSPSGSSNDRTDQDEPNLSLASLSPSDDLFFKGNLVPIEISDQTNPKPQFPVPSLLKSATKFRVFMLGLKKSKSGNVKTETAVESSPATAKQGKFFTVKFKVEEVPIVSLFTRDNSSRGSAKPAAKQTTDGEAPATIPTANSPEEKRFAREVMQKYLKMVKPLYVRVSRRYGEKLKLAGGASVKPASPPATESPAEAPATVSEGGESQVVAKGGLNLPAGLRVVCKHLGKSRSASAAAIAVAPATATADGTMSSRRRDDSLIQQQDGIQSAILHCKRSFNAARDSEDALLARRVSDPQNEKKSLDVSRKSSDGTNQRS